MSSNGDFVLSLDAVSMHSLGLDDAPRPRSNASSMLDAQFDAAVLASVLQLVDNPEQLANLSDEDRERVLHIAHNYRQEVAPDEVGASSQAVADEDDSSDIVEAEDSFGSVTHEASLALSMRMLHEEMGDPMLRDMSRSAVFEIVRSVGKVVCAGSDQSSAALLELLDCSAAVNIVQRLRAWPACHERLRECAAGSQFRRLFNASMRELNERAGDAQGEQRDPSSEGVYRLGQCDICCSEADCLLWSGGCCQTGVCVSCLHRWLIDHLTDVRAKLGCPGCSNVLTMPQLRHLLSDSAIDRREQLLARQRGSNRNERDCPRCSCLTQRPRRGGRRRRKELGGLTVTCAQCNYVWCFDCHSPAHPGVPCRQFQSGAHLLEDWAKQMERTGLRKARRCPKCKAMIEKNEGCNHITCAHCQHEFCYLCSKRWRVPQLKLPFLRWSVFGSHSSRLSVFGCREKFLPDRPALRRLIRGSLFVLRALALIVGPVVGVAVLLPLILALIGIAIPLSPLLIPLLVFYFCMRRSHTS